MSEELQEHPSVIVMQQLAELGKVLAINTTETQNIKEMVTEIKAQTIKTNGRVGALESWKGFIIGGLSIITLLVIPLIASIIIRNMSDIQELKKQVQIK